MEDTLQAEYQVYLKFRELGYSRASALLLLAINIEMIMYEELENL